MSRMKRPAAAFDRAADVDVAGFLFNVVKEDINFKKISAIMQRWNVRSKVLSDDLEEDEDLHNKLKCDQITSDEQIAADNVKISTLETSISGESARVAQLIEEIGTLEKDIAASKSEFSLCDRDLRETVGGILRGPQINVLGY